LHALSEDISPLANARWGYEGSHDFIVYGLPALQSCCKRLAARGLCW
jgi:hypothetical protein